MLIRQEAETDHSAIDRVHRGAFAPFAEGASGSEPVEVGLVRALRADPGWISALSLVAQADDGRVVGHVVCTVGTVDQTRALGLGPLGVLPEHQGTGVGGALMHAVLAAADALGFPVVVLLGHASYYPRFGFEAANRLGIAPTDPAWGESFQARRLTGWTPAITGTFRYAAPFDAL